MAAPTSRPEHSTLADFLRIMRQRWMMIFVLALGVVSSAAVGTALLPRWYLSTAQVRVEKPDGAVIAGAIRSSFVGPSAL